MNRNNGFQLGRRQFMTLGAIALGAASMPLLGAGTATEPLSPAPGRRHKLAAVFQEMPYFDQGNEAAEHYQPPRKNTATVNYVNSISEETLLRRHYYC